MQRCPHRGTFSLSHLIVFYVPYVFAKGLALSIYNRSPLALVSFFPIFSHIFSPLSMIPLLSSKIFHSLVYPTKAAGIKIRSTR